MSTKTSDRIYPRGKWSSRTGRTDQMGGNGTIREAFIHHSDDADGLAYNTMGEQIAKLRGIQHFHMDVRGWSDIAYHYVVFQRVGKRNEARAFAARPTRFAPAAQEKHNMGTLAICIVGNGEREELFRNTRFIIELLIRKYPNVRTVGGHRDVVATTCPGRKFYASVPKIAGALDLKRYGGR